MGGLVTGLDQIVIPPPGLSLGADIFRAHRTGELSWSEYLTANACMVASLCHEERPRLYVVMPPVAKHYAEARIADARGYDQAASKTLGQWRYDIFQAMDHNVYVEQHFQWALDKVQGVKLHSEAEKLSNAVRRFEGLKFPHAPYQLACDVLKLDSDWKQRNQKAAK
jgi:hypothetical protein